jgi:hypothetical protein
VDLDNNQLLRADLTQVDNHAFSSLDKKFAKTLLKARKLDDIKLRESFLLRNLFFLKNVMYPRLVPGIFFPKASLARLFEDHLLNFKRSTMFFKVVAYEKFLFIEACILFGAEGARQIMGIIRRLISEDILPLPQILCDLCTLNKLLSSPVKISFFFTQYFVRCGSLRKIFSLIYSESKLIKKQFVELVGKIKKVDWLKEDLNALGAHFDILVHKTKSQIKG